MAGPKNNPKISRTIPISTTIASFKSAESEGNPKIYLTVFTHTHLQSLLFLFKEVGKVETSS
ncbi:hypothetical protein CsSME_00031019 [Camellia sinensis var. sinensis]